ncbi:CopD family protein [Teredinibacter purpureus]|uniref:CopD family protein n=1 Tax=Teredinibacter purpureus TaxID=2731756 RepID=UPI0005F8779F|nr:CopD family protein [Teredinibacter purpureus]
MLWVKAIHIIAVVCWFAMLFYLPRLFVYHAMSDDQNTKNQFKIMERKLYWGIGLPSLWLTIIFGVWVTTYAWDYYTASTWFWIKMALVAILVVYHHVCGYFIRQLRDNLCTKSHVFFRWFNEVPTVILLACVFLVVVKQPL